MSVTAAGENAGQLHKAGCAAPPTAAPPALCPRHDYSGHVIVGKFTFVKQPEQINVSGQVGGIGVRGTKVTPRGRDRRRPVGYPGQERGLGAGCRNPGR